MQSFNFTLSTSFAAYFLFKSIRTSWVLTIQRRNKAVVKLPLEEVYQQQQLKELEAILKKNFSRIR